MSDTSEALPQARSAIGLGTIFRLLAIALGIASALELARDRLGLRMQANMNLWG